MSEFLCRQVCRMTYIRLHPGTGTKDPDPGSGGPRNRARFPGSGLGTTELGSGTTDGTGLGDHGSGLRILNVNLAPSSTSG